MKKVILIICICVSMLTACNPNNSKKEATPTVAPQASPSPSVVKTASASDYFSFNNNIHMKYKGTGNEFAEFDTYVDYLEPNIAQVRKLDGATEVVTVYKLENGEFKSVFSRPETYYRYNYMSSTGDEEILIKEPIEKGTSWTLKNGSTRTITEVNKDISTPAGDFKTIEVTTTQSNSTTKHYYSKGVGLVKSEFTPINSNDTIISELEKIEKNAFLKQKIKIYNPDPENSKIVYFEKEISIDTNSNPDVKTVNLLKFNPKEYDLSRVLPPNTILLSTKLDDTNGIVSLDFTSELVTDLNAGSSLESMVLQCIANTFGEYYNKSKVNITINGKPYESGHISMNQGEYLTVSTKNIEKFNLKKQ